nr:MAG TPA: hypothetical protein [Caudoviricetes sp.]DAL76043.1 MAG TPA: hypothetical protein [Caudoviricetes sp.]
MFVLITLLSAFLIARLITHIPEDLSFMIRVAHVP